MKNNPALMASNLSFNRSIAPSPALLTAFDSANPYDLQPVLLTNTIGRGAFLNSYLDKKGEIAEDFDPSKPNIVEGDMANLPPSCDSFRMDFTINVTAGSIEPNSCEIPALDALFRDISKAYKKAGGYIELSERFVWRLLNGSIMWRNYTVSSDKKVTISFEQNSQTYTFEAQCRNLSKLRYPGFAAMRDAVANVEHLVTTFAEALSVDGDPLILRVTATGKVGYGSEVYPSQVFNEISDKDKRDRSVKKLVSHDLGNGRRQGKINATKIGNAIRHIDEWHGSPDEDATSIEAYGFVQRNLSALRPVQGENFYNLLWQQSDTFPSILAECSTRQKIPGSIHYFMAMLIRGGVFAAPSNSSKPKTNGKRSKEELS
jgi:CRISPR-associated protein Csy3